MLIFDAYPISNWYSLLLLTGFLSVTQETKDSVKLCLIDSLRNCCCSGECTRRGMHRFTLLIVTLESLPPRVVQIFFCFSFDLFSWGSNPKPFVIFLKVLQKPKICSGRRLAVFLPLLSSLVWLSVSICFNDMFGIASSCFINFNAIRC